MDPFLNRFGAFMECQMVDFGSQNHRTLAKMVSEIDPKSIKSFRISPKRRPKSKKISRLHRGCVFGTFFERFWAPTGGSHHLSPGPFGDHFQSKIEKMASKKASKNRCRKSIENRCPNDTKMIPKGMPKSMIVYTFSKKAKSHETVKKTIEF